MPTQLSAASLPGGWPGGLGSPEQLVRAAAIAGCALAVLLGVCGLTEGVLFAAPSLLKYALTVAAPVLGILFLTIEHPLRLAVGLTIVCIPFGGAKATFGGEQVSLLLVMLAASVVLAILTGPRPRLPSRAGAATIACVALLVVPLLLGSDTGDGVVIATMVLVGWLVARVAREGDDAVVSIYWALAASALLQAVIAIYEFKTKHHLNLYGSAGAGLNETTYFGTAAGHAGELHTTQRPSGTLYDPISLGNVLAVSCPIIVVLAVRTREPLARLALAVAGLAVLLALALSFSRFSWIGAGAGTVAACLAMPRPGLRLGGLLAAGAIVVVAVVFALAAAGPTLIARFHTISNPTQAANRITASGDREREQAWHADLTTFFEHPLAGVGLGQIRFSLARYLPNVREGSNGQNTYLQIAAEAGLLGLAALAILLGTAASGLYRGLRSSPVLAAGALGGGLAIVIVWLTDVTIRYTPVAAFFAIILGVASALPYARLSPDQLGLP
jgi:O-Antigen ligase